jgi:hypothetical protein
MEADAMSAKVLEDTRGLDWVRRVHVMAGSEAECNEALAELPRHATIVERSVDELRIHHMKVAWPMREAVSIQFKNPDAHWDVVVYWIGQGRVSEAMLEAGVMYRLATGRDPLAAFVRKFPNTPEFVPGLKISEVEVCGMPLVEVDWVLDGFVVISGGENAKKGLTA